MLVAGFILVLNDSRNISNMIEHHSYFTHHNLLLLFLTATLGSSISHLFYSFSSFSSCLLRLKSPLHPPYAFDSTQNSDWNPRRSKFKELFNGQGLPQSTAIIQAKARATQFKTWCDARFSRMWQWINWARPRIALVEAEVIGLTTRIIETEERFVGRPPLASNYKHFSSGRRVSCFI